jgi:hypothetical protein
LREFEKRMLRRIFGPKRGDVTGDWGTLHNKELYKWYSVPNVRNNSRRVRWAGHVARTKVLISLRIRTSVGFCKHGNELTGYTKGEKFLGWLRDY